MVLKLCREFHCLPSQLYAEDSELLRMLVIEKMGKRERTEEEE